MANNSRNDDFPTIRLDDEDRRDYHKKQQVNKPGGPKAPPPPKPAKGAKSSGGGWVVFNFILLLSAGGALGYFSYESQLKLEAAEARIANLENKLSATGEEIGESSVALQVKVTELGNRTNELWEQMDKLWASAWRRNQKEIAELADKVGNVQSNLNESISQVARNTDLQKTQLSALQSQLSAVADDLLALNVRLEQTAEQSAGFAQSQKTVADKLTLLEQRNNALSSRISTLENEIREIATQMVSQPAANPQ